MAVVMKAVFAFFKVVWPPAQWDLQAPHVSLQSFWTSGLRPIGIFNPAGTCVCPWGWGQTLCTAERGTWWETALRPWVLLARGCENVACAG